MLSCKIPRRWSGGWEGAPWYTAEHLSWVAIWPWCLARFAPAQQLSDILQCEGLIKGEGSQKHLVGSRVVMDVKLCVESLSHTDVFGNY